MKYTFLDVEASGLEEGSYPIQIGWVCTNGESDQFLVNPDSSDGWDHWCRFAEVAIHNISREECIQDGLTVHSAAVRLNSQLATLTVVSDASEWDAGWIDKLFDAAGVIRKFDIIDVREMLSRIKCDVQPFLDERKCHKVVHRSIADCVMNIKSGAACGYWLVHDDFVDIFGEILTLNHS